MKFPLPLDRQMPSIVEQNRDVETFVVQASAARTIYFKDPFVPLQFVHFADVHYETENWERIVEYINYYEDLISFALHTGDYCKSCQEAYVDLYNVCKPCTRPILNCVGNHDTCLNRAYDPSPKSVTHSLLFNRMDGWDVTFMPGESSMTYSKDIPESNVRLIVLDCYYDFEEQIAWLKAVLDEAKEKGYHVITASHEFSHTLTRLEDVSFQSVDPFSEIASEASEKPFEDTIADFKDAGGIHICHLAGHYHHDRFGYTARGVLNIAVESATHWPFWCDGKRVRGTRTFDCFNVVSVDVNQNLLKLVRVGNNCDHYLRQKRALCYDYKNQTVIADN